MRSATGLSHNASQRQGERGEIWTEHTFMSVWSHLTFRCDEIWKWRKGFCLKVCTGCFVFVCFFVYHHATIVWMLLWCEHNRQKFCTMYLSSWWYVGVCERGFSVCVSVHGEKKKRSLTVSCMICCEWPLLANWGQHESQCSSCVNTYTQISLSYAPQWHTPPPTGCWTCLRKKVEAVVALHITNSFQHPAFRKKEVVFVWWLKNWKSEHRGDFLLTRRVWYVLKL